MQRANNLDALFTNCCGFAIRIATVIPDQYKWATAATLETSAACQRMKESKD